MSGNVWLTAISKCVFKSDDCRAPHRTTYRYSTSLLGPISCTGLSWNPSFLGVEGGSSLQNPLDVRKDFFLKVHLFFSHLFPLAARFEVRPGLLAFRRIILPFPAETVDSQAGKGFLLPLSSPQRKKRGAKRVPLMARV